MGSRYIAHAATKDSGVLWMGRIPEHWDVGKLAYIFTKDNAGEVIDKNFWGDGKELLYTCKRTPLLSDYSAFPERKRTTIKDLLLTRNGTPYIHLPEAGSIYSNVVQRIQLSEQFDRGYCAYALSDAALNLRGYGVSIESFNFEMWKALNMCFPPLEEQKTIARFLDHETAKIDELIAKQERLIELLKEKRQAVISHAVTKGLNPDVPMKDSGVEWLGEVPEHWSLAGFKHYLSIVDYRGKTPEKVDDGVLLVTARNIKGGKIDYEVSREYIRLESYDEVMSRGKPKVGDVLFTTEAPLGEAACVDDTSVALAQRIMKFRGYESRLDNYYLKYFILSHGFQSGLYRYSTGSTALGIKSDRLCYLRMLLPPLNEQQSIVRYIESEQLKYDKAIAAGDRQIGLLKERRTALISAAVTGKIDVRNWKPGDNQ